MPYAIYLRKSRADAEAEARGEGETLARHERALMELAVRNGYDVGQMYREIVSGDSIANRPQMQLLLADVAARKYQGVLVMEIERLARGDTMDQAIVANTFRFSNTLIITPFKTYDPNNNMDEEYFEFSLFMSRREYKTIVRRMQTGRALASKEGKYIGSIAPYGYERYRRVDGVCSLRPVESEAATVRQIFGWALSGMGNSKIAQTLNSLGIPSAGGVLWSASTVWRLLHNPVYAGYVTWSKRVKTATGIENGHKVYERKVNENAICARGLHEPLVSEETFHAIDAAMKSACVPLRNARSISNPFAGILKCAECGHAMIGLHKPHRGSSYYLSCRTYGCKNVGCICELLEEIVLRTLEQWATEYQTEPEKRREEMPQEKAAALIRRQLEQLQAQRAKLCDYLERGIYDEETYMQRSITLNAQIKSAQESLDAATAAPIEQDTESCIRAVAPFCASAADAYRIATTAEEKNKILRSVISKIVYAKDKRGNSYNDHRDSIRVEIFPAVH